MVPRVMRGDYTVALNLTGNGLDDPDQLLYENFTCGAEGNYDAIAARSSTRWSTSNRWNLIRQSARIWYGRSSASWPKSGAADPLEQPLGDLPVPLCQGYTPMVNSIYNGLRMEDVWLDR